MKQSYASVALATYILECQINACISVPSPGCVSAFQTTAPRKSTSFHALALLNACASEAHSGIPLLQQGSAPGHHCQQQDFTAAHLCRKALLRYTVVLKEKLKDIIMVVLEGCVVFRSVGKKN